MKKRLNNKGFTLIETVITFAIVAVVGGMFILGFSNVIHLMTDAELIKNDTNELYSDVLSDTDVNVQDQKVKLKIDGQDYEEAVKVSSKTMNDGSTVVKLSKFASNSDVAWAPSDSDEEGTGSQEPENPDIPEDAIQIHFSILNDDVTPSNRTINAMDLRGEIIQNQYYPYTYTIELSLSSQFSSDTVLCNPTRVNEILLGNNDLKSELSKTGQYDSNLLINKFFQINGNVNNGTIKWYRIQKISEYQYNVYGYVSIP